MGLPKSIHVHGSLSDISVLAEPAFPIISATAITCVDCGNFYDAKYNNLFSIVDFQESNAVSTSYVRTFFNENVSVGNADFTYRIRSSYSGKVHFGLRCAFTTEFTGCTLNFYYSNVLTLSVNLTLEGVQDIGGFNRFYFIYDDFITFDSDARDFKIQVTGAGVLLDSIVFNSAPVNELDDIQPYVVSEHESYPIFCLQSSLDESISLSFQNLKKKIDYSSLTLHLQLYLLDKEQDVVIGFLKCSSFINTNSIVFDNGWISFNLEYFMPYSSDDQNLIIDNYRIGISLIGCHKNENLYFIWSQSDRTDSPVLMLKKNDSSSLEVSNYNLAIKMFESRDEDSSTGDIVTSAPEIEKLIISKFSKYHISKSINSSIINKGVNSEEIILKLPDRTMTLLVDMSGSMTWNDPYGDRLNIASDILDRFSGGYPGNLNYQIITFGGTPILTEWFGVTESEVNDTSDANEVKRKAFFDEAFKFNGVQIVRRKGRAPATPTDGDIVYSGYSKIFYDTNLEPNAEYYYSIFSQTDDGRFSDPVIVKAVPEPRLVPSGIKNLNGLSIKASGIPKDEYTSMLLHMDEGNDVYIHDFSHGSILQYENINGMFATPLWIDQSESPPSSDDLGAGKGSGIRFNGSSEFLKVTDNKIDSSIKSELGIMIWVYPFSSNDSTIDEVMGLLKIQLLSGESIKVNIQTDNTIMVSSPFGSFVSSLTVDTNSWNHICIFSDSNSSTLYINGVSEVLASIFEPSIISDLEIGRSSSNEYFFGKITEFSLHSSIRSYSYVSGHYESILSWNGDNIAVLKFTVPSSYIDGKTKYSIRYKPELGPLRHIADDISGPANHGNYIGANNFSGPDGSGLQPSATLSARLAFGDDVGPSNPEDGEEIIDGIIDKTNYRHVIIKNFASRFDETEFRHIGIDCPGFRHFFRIFIINDKDISSLPEDSGLFQYNSPVYRTRDTSHINLPSVKNVEVFSGDSKIYLKWDNEYSKDIRNIVIFFSRNDHPDIVGSINTGGNDQITFKDHYPVFIGDINSNEFVLRKGILEYAKRNTNNPDSPFQSMGFGRCPECDLLNGKNAYFSIYTRDKYGNYGEPVEITAVPNINQDDLSIPPDLVFAIRSQPVDDVSISIKWINPSRIRHMSDIECWLDDRIIFYFKATDIFGRKLETNYEFSFRTNISSRVSSTDDFSRSGYIVAQGANTSGFTGMLWNQNISPPIGFTDSNTSILFDPERKTSVREILYFSDISKKQEVKNSSDGYYKIFFDLSNADSDQLSGIHQVYFVAFVFLRTSKDMNDEVIGTARSFDAQDSFEYTSFPIRVLMTNPLAVKSYNSTSVPYPMSFETSFEGTGVAPPNPCEVIGTGFGGDNSMNENSIEAYGCYVTRKDPYSILIRAMYKNKPLPPGFTARVYIFSDDDPIYYATLPLGFETRFGSKTRWGGSCSGEPGGSAVCYTGQTEWPIDPHLGNYPFSTLGILDNVAEFYEHSSGYFSECLYKIPVPLDPFSIRVIFKIEQDGIFACPQNYLNFVSNLNININTVSPIADGKNIARQSCFAYTVDPNFIWADGFTTSFQQQFFIPVPDFTPIQWEIIKYRNTSERPFYSTASTNDGFFVLADGVFDFTQNGYSRNVFFGPASGVIYKLGYINNHIIQIPEEYIIKATVVYNGNKVSAFGSACIHPVNSSSVDNPELPSIKKSSILCCSSDGNYVQNIYSDGKDFASFIIAKDPEITYTESSDLLRSTTGAFLKCYNSVLFPDSNGMDDAYITKISTGKPVFIETIKVNSYTNPIIKHWANSVIINYQNLVVSIENGSMVAIGEKSSINNAIVSMEQSNNTEFAISSNAFIPTVWSRHGDPTIQGDIGILCSHIHGNPYGSVGNNSRPEFAPFIDYDIEIKASTSDISNGVNIDLISPGNWGTGNPPKFIKFIEPLRVDLVYILVDGIPNTAVKIDGTSINRLVFVATFAGRNISTSSPIRIYECGTSIVAEEQEIVYCEIKDDPFFTGVNYSGNPIPGYIPGMQSFFYVDLEVLDPSTLVDSKIFAECNYDESGSITRQRVLGVKIKHIPSAFSGGESFVLPVNDGENGSSSSSDSSFNGQDSGTGFFVGGGDSSGFTDSSSSSSSSNNIPDLEPTVPPEDRPLYSSMISNKCYAYDLALASQPSSSAWYRIADMLVSRMFHSTCNVGGKIYAIGGVSNGGITSYMECWSPETNQWSGRSSMPESKYGMQTSSDSRYIYCFGGVEMYGSNSVCGDSLTGNDSPPFGGGPSGGNSSSSSQGSSSSSFNFSRPRVSTSAHRYDTHTDTWISLKSMPILDINGNDISDSIIPPNLGLVKYGIAFGQSHIIDGNIYIVCGSNSVHLCAYEPLRMNDRILVYCIATNKWLFTEEFSDIVKATYQRVHASSFVDQSGRIVVFGGTKYVIENDDSYSVAGGSYRHRILSKDHATDTCYIDINSIGGSQSSAINTDIGDASYLFTDLPVPREMASCLKLNSDIYILGGRIHKNGDYPGTSASKKFERLNLVGSKYLYERLEKPIFGIRAFGMVSVGESKIVYCGGFSSNETLGYTKIDVHAYGEQTESNTGLISRFEDVSAVIRLDGRSSCDIAVTLYDDEGDLLENPINVELYGSIKFPTEDDFENGVGSGQFSQGSELMTRILRRRGTRVYPIQISPSSSISVGGKIFAKLLPRTEDPLRTLSEITAILNRDFTSDQIGDQSDSLRIMQNITRFPYQIVISAQIIDDFYFGNTTYNPASSSSSSGIYDYWFPELNSSDSNADAGEFDGARSLPPFKVINTNSSSGFGVTCFHGNGPMLMTKQNGLIATLGDSDLFGVTVPKTGTYKISVMKRGFSGLKAKLKIFNTNRSPYIVCDGTFVEANTSQVINRLIAFADIDGCPSCWPAISGQYYSPTINLIAGHTYYLEVSSFDSSLNITESDSASPSDNDPNIVALSERVGEYQLLIGSKLTESEAIYYANIFNSVGSGSPGFRSLTGENTSGIGGDGSSSTSYLGSLMDNPQCPFECPSCVVDFSRWAGLSCVGSNNTFCIDVSVNASVPPDTFAPRSMFAESSSTSSYYDPYAQSAPLPPALLPAIDESIGIIFSSANLNKIIFDNLLGSGYNPTINLSPIIQYYSDFDWIPEIREILKTSDGSYLNASLAISRLKNVIPFGCSPVFDGLSYAIKSYNTNDLDPYFSGSKETIYILTDNDENTSDNNPDTIATEINSLNGAGETPVVVYNINLFKPTSIANEASLANAGSLPSLIKQVGGEVINYVDKNSHDKYLDYGIGEAIGSIGHGEFEFVLNFDDEITINGISYNYVIPLYTNILWNIESSTDGEHFNVNNAYNNISKIEQELNIKGKFIKIKFKLIHTFKDSVIDPYSDTLSAEVPKISSITIKYNHPRENIIVLNSLNFAADPQQISVSILSENDEFSDIYIGVSSRGSTDWNNYFKESQPFAHNNGKIFIPLRDIGIDDAVIEPLRIINGFTYFAEHGSWNIDSIIKVMDRDQEIDPSSYKSFSSSGEIVFNKSVHLTDPKILITNLKAFNIAIKCVNYNSNKAAIIKGISLFANTNKKLEALNLNRKPIAYNLRFINRPVGIYTPIDIKYNFADLDGDIEDKSKTLIKWYKNGAEVQELTNQTTFNDLNNPDDVTYDYVYSPDSSGRIYAEIAQATGIFPEVLAALRNESLFNSGDIIYFTVQPHDSVQYGDIARSEAITISDITDYPSYIRIRGRLYNGVPPDVGLPGGGSGNNQAIVITTLFNKRAILFADFDFYSYELMLVSKIKWYVNGSVWKTENLINTGNPISPASYEIYPNDKIGNTTANTIGNLIEVEISVPRGVGESDFVIKSEPPIQIVNCLPVVSFAEISLIISLSQGGRNTWVLSPSYSINDPDIFQGSSQSDQSTVRWYYSIDNELTWIFYPRAQPMSNLIIEASSSIQKWKINVTPYDGMQQGESMDSNIVVTDNPGP